MERIRAFAQSICTGPHGTLYLTCGLLSVLVGLGALIFALCRFRGGKRAKRICSPAMAKFCWALRGRRVLCVDLLITLIIYHIITQIACKLYYMIVKSATKVVKIYDIHK